MPDLKIMTRAALDAMRQVLDLAAEDVVLVIGDDSAGACPDGMIDLLEDRNVVINAIAGRSDEVPFRLQWLSAVEDLDLRMGHSPGICDRMMEGGALDVDYAAMREGAKRVIGLFRDADSVHITTAAGTDLTLGLTERRMVSDVHITLTEKGANLPCGEAYCCPVEDRADGVLVIDGCYGCEGNVSVPVTITCRSGQVVDVTSDDPAITARVNELMDTDDGSRTIAELGIGLNPGAGLQGNMLEDEKALRTAHIAFGSNMGMPDGRNQSTMHMDYLFHRPTMTVTREDGSTACVIRDGDIL